MPSNFITELHATGHYSTVSFQLVVLGTLYCISDQRRSAAICFEVLELLGTGFTPIRGLQKPEPLMPASRHARV